MWHQSRFFGKGEDIEYALRLVREKVSDPEDESLRTNKNSSDLIGIRAACPEQFSASLFIKYALCYCSRVNKLQRFPVFLEMNIN